MRAAVYYETGGPDVFVIEEVPEQDVGPDDVRIAVEAISIEGGDTLNRLGGEMTRTPHIVGYQCAGSVLEVGEQVSGISVGDRVVTVGVDGSHAERRVVGQSFCWLIPDGVSTEDAACVPVPFGTAHDCLFEFGRLAEGEFVLVHAGASGVGIAAIQMAARFGATVIATASSDDRLARLVPFGLDHGINYVTDDFVSGVRAVTGGHGADVIIESIGGSNLTKSLACLAYRGRCLTFGDAGREAGQPIDISSLRGNNQSLIGYFLGAELFMAPRAHAMVASILADVASDEIKVVIDQRFALEEAADAHRYIEDRLAFGRVLLIP